MANNNDAFTAMLLPQMMAQTQAMQQMAMRPQKSYATTTTTSTSTPYALADMIARRDSIGDASRALEDALKKREDLGYVLASSLGAIPQQQGYGSWLTDFARSLGGGMATPTNLEVDRAQKKYEADMADLQQALAFDKAMGETQTQKQTENIGYTEVPSGKTNTTDVGSLSGVQTNNFSRSIGYDPVENIPDYGPMTRAALSEEQMGTLKYVPFAQSIAKGLTDKTASTLQSTWSDISDNILSGRVLDFVGKAGGIRVADTPAEQEFIFGPIRNYQNMSERQLRVGLKQARNNFVASGMNKVAMANQSREQQGLPKLEITEDELKNWWNSAFSVPEGMATEKMYNIQDKPKPSTREPIKIGDVRNGIRFLGYNEDGSKKFERVK